MAELGLGFAVAHWTAFTAKPKGICPLVPHRAPICDNAGEGHGRARRRRTRVCAASAADDAQGGSSVRFEGTDSPLSSPSETPEKQPPRQQRDDHRIRAGYVHPGRIVSLLRSGGKEEALEAYRSTQPKYQYEMGEVRHMISEFGRLHSEHAAEIVLNEFEDAVEGKVVDISLYNALLHAFSFRGNLPGLERTFDRISSEEANAAGLQPDHISYGILVESYARKGKVVAAESALRVMTNANITPDAQVFTGLIRAYASRQDAESVRRCLLRMKQLGVRLDRVLYNVLLGLAKKKGDVRAAERLFGRMRKDGVDPDQSTFTTLIQIYSRAGDLKRARSAFEYIQVFGLIPDRFAFCAMISAYAREGDVRSAQETFEEMEELDVAADAAIYNAILALRLKRNMEVDSLLDRMAERGVKQDHVTRSILAGIGQSYEGSAPEAEGGNVPSGLSLPDEMRLFASKRDVDQAKSIGTADTAIYNIAIRALIKARRSGTAMTTLTEMRSRFVQYDAETFCHWMVLLALDRETPLSAPYDLLKDMKLCGLKPDAAIFNAMFGVAAVRPTAVLKEMRIRSIELDVHTNRALIRAYVKRNHVTRAWDVLKGLDEWDAKSVGLVCRSLRRIQMHRQADAVEQKAAEKGINLKENN